MITQSASTAVNIHQRSVDFLSLLAGACLTFAFSPFDIGYIAWLTPAWLFLLWRNATPWRACWRGLLFGIGFFAGSVSWIFISIYQYGNTHIIVAIFITLLFILLLSLAPAITGYAAKQLCNRFTHISSLFGVPSIWVLLEFVRSYLFSGFPWVLLGQSQLHTPLNGFIPIVGVYGASWLSAFIGMCLLLYYHYTVRYHRVMLLGTVIMINLLGYGLSFIHWTKPTGTLKVALVQGDIARSHKWNSEHVINNINIYKQLSQPLWKKNRLIVWPENAIAIPNTQATHFLSQLQRQAMSTNTTLITGLPIASEASYYNGALALGRQMGAYLKRHLVPFGEYVPFGDSLRDVIGFFSIPILDFTKGPSQQLPVRVSTLSLAVFICYEIAYAPLVRHSAQDTNTLIVLSDDSWFGRSVASQQQLQIAQIRALETGRYVLSATNNGQTATINPQGHITAHAPAYQAAVLETTVQPMQGNTPWLLIGMWPILIGCIILLLMAVVWQRWGN